MYKIIGADQKEYGPVPIHQIRQWIIEGRVNAQTSARAEGDPEWKPLGAFPDFAEALGSASLRMPSAFPAGAPTAAGADPRSAALSAVSGPAIGLIVTSGLNILYGVWQLVNLAIRHATFEMPPGMPALHDPQIQRILQLAYGPIGIASAAFALLMTVLILIGAFRMRALRTYPLAITASILAVVPCITPCCLVCLPFGIWALVVLNRPDVKLQFN
jgi:GYF domain 2